MKISVISMTPLTRVRKKPVPKVPQEVLSLEAIKAVLRNIPPAKL